MTDESKPKPLVPACVDLTGYGWMPLHGHRLFGSTFNANCSDAEWRAGVTLWWAAWNQVPAASLPDDDTALCRLADLGRDVKGWKKLRMNALHGFVLCSDGRLYHKVLAELAIEAWNRRLKERARKDRWRYGIERSSDVPVTSQGNVSNTQYEASQDTSLERQKTRDGTADRKRQDRTANSESATTIQPVAARTEPAAAGVDEPEFDQAIPENLDRRPKAAEFHAAGKAVLEAMGVAGDPRWTGNYGRVQAWLTSGADLELDILPTIRRALEKRGNQPPIRSLGYFDQAIADTLAKRTGSLPKPSPNGAIADPKPYDPFKFMDPETVARLKREAAAKTAQPEGKTA